MIHSYDENDQFLFRWKTYESEFRFKKQFCTLRISKQITGWNVMQSE